MSGTSMDGVDGVVARLGPTGQWLGTLAHAHRPFPAPLRDAFWRLNTPGDDELHTAALAGADLSRLYAQVVSDLRQKLPADAASEPLQAVGAHGQTVRHRPELGYTLQVLNPALLAELTGLDVVADFRSRDVAAGGHGAPLVPVFHHAVFGQQDHDVAVLNIGGMANVSLLPAQHSTQAVMGFDCGPGNALMDLWCQQQRGLPYDDNGLWARSGQVNDRWLEMALSEPFFSLPPPKSTGRDLFNLGWLQQWLQRCGLPDSTHAADVQATLCELTAHSAAQAIHRFSPAVTRVLVCGGGALNAHLMTRLSALLQHWCRQAVTVQSTADWGLPPMEVEAAAFAWLAWACRNRVPGNVPAVTGAPGPRVLGAIYPAASALT